MIKILAIGNSFSVDATHYLYGISRAGGVETKLYDLYEPGCPLSKHFRAMHSGTADYALYFNGMGVGLRIALRAALTSDDWDVVTLQQASYLSVDYATYQPYLGELAGYVRALVPQARLMIHQTWAYERGSARLIEELGYREPEDMYLDIKAAYAQAAKDIRADGMIPCGELMQRLGEHGIAPVHRDTYHAHPGVGRYALAALWYEMISGQAIIGNTFRDLDTSTEEIDFALVQRIVHEVALDYGSEA